MDYPAAIARMLAKLIAQAQNERQAPSVEETGATSAQFVIETPTGRFRVDVTEVW